MKQKGININLWSILLFILVAFLMILFGIKMREAGIRMDEQAQIDENRRACEVESRILSDGSDYLTNEVFHFVATRDKTFLKNYWQEVNLTRSRDKAIENLTALSLTQEEQRLVEQAKQASDQLIEGEAWAMRLTADSMGMAVEEMPERVAAVTYTHGEEKLNSQQKLNLATQYLFGGEYTAVKDKIDADIKAFQDHLRNRKNEELKNAAANTAHSLASARNLMIPLTLAFALEAILFYGLIIRPFYYYTRSLEQIEGTGFTALTPMGSRETRAFAGVFNQIYREWVEQKQRLEKERYRFHVALDNTSDLVYEYDVSMDSYVSFGNLMKSPHPTAQLQQEQILPDFLKKCAKRLMGQPGVDYFQEILNKKISLQADLVFYPSREPSQKIWTRITGTPILGENNQVSRIIGRISNIQAEKENEWALEDARSRDGLTGLYSRDAGSRKVREYMEQKPSEIICCMMLVDMDHFKQVNESLGQAYGDAVLQDVADILRSETQPDDILVRLGGDEFMLFIKNCPKSRATKLGPEIAEKIKGLSNQNNPDSKISASIGMCVTQVVDEYSGLYRCAESTLNYIKEHEKGTAACYLDACNSLGLVLTQMYPGRHLINDIDRTNGAWEDLSSFALDLLGKSRNLDDAIFLLLSRVGKAAGLDRILIVEVGAEFLNCQIVYQWCKQPSDRLSQEPYYLTKEELRKLTDAYDSQGLCEQYVITRPSKACMESVIQAAIWNYGQCAGVMSFELHQPHQWTVKERQLIKDLTKIISSFTLKARADAVSKAKTDFLSRMSHEIRTPMNAISGMTIIAKKVPHNPPKTLDCLNKIESANKYLLRLINDILDMSRIESGMLEIHPAPARLDQLILNLDTLIRPQTDDKGISFVVENHFTDKRYLMADVLRLSQVLVNLLGNAVKFTEKGGTITLAIIPVESKEKEVSLCFSVADSGIGISEEAQKRIFNAFEQADSNTTANYGGTGLGLAISNQLVQLMGGSLEVDSRQGKGSCFSFTLNLSYAVEQEYQDQQSKELGISFDPQGIRILLVEDNQLNQEIAQDILEMNGFEVVTANNGREAVAAFENQECGYFDAILMDIRMPVMGGMEAARKIRTLEKQDSRTIPIIAMTANAFDEDMEQSLKNGMDAHLSKPIDVTELLSTLEKLIHSRTKLC